MSPFGTLLPKPMKEPRGAGGRLDGALDRPPPLVRARSCRAAVGRGVDCTPSAQLVETPARRKDESPGVRFHQGSKSNRQTGQSVTKERRSQTNVLRFSGACRVRAFRCACESCELSVGLGRMTALLRTD